MSKLAVSHGARWAVIALAATTGFVAAAVAWSTHTGWSRCERILGEINVKLDRVVERQQPAPRPDPAKRYVVPIARSADADRAASPEAMRRSIEHPVMATAMQMLIGGVALAIGGAARGESMPLHASATAWLAVAYLAVFGSIIGFTAYDWLLRNARPVVATSYAYVNPIIAVLIGAALHGEALGWSTLVANVLIVSAVMLALRRK